MKIRLKHLILENFLSFGYAEIDLNDRGYVLVNGINNNPTDNATSNGSGKSSIWEAISYALTGETIRGITKNLVNIHTEGGMRVELSFSIDSTEYRICRYKEHKEFKNDIKFFVNGVDNSGKGVRDTEKLISEHLPDLTSSLIGSVIILGQGLPQRFSNNTPSGRKEVLEKLSKSDFMIEDIKKRISDRKSVLNKNLREIEDSTLSKNSQLSVIEKQLNSYREQLNSLEDRNSYVEKIRTTQEKVAAVQVELDSLNNAISETRILGDNLTDQLNSQITLYNAEVQSRRVGLDEEIKNYQSQDLQLRADIRSLQNEVLRLKSVVDVCPTCKQKLPDVHKVDTTERESQLETLRAEESRVAGCLKGKEEELSNLLQDIKQKYESTQLDIKNQLNESKITLTNLNKKRETYESEYRAQSTYLSNLQLSLQNVEQRKVSIESTIQELEKDISRLNSEIGYNTVEKDDVKGRSEIVNKMLNIATREFRGYLLTNVISYINKKAKDYSRDIFKTDKIELTLDGNNINISYDDKMYENLSGGEQRKVDIICQLSLRDMLSQFSDFHSNVLILDEVFENLDYTGCQSVIDTISKKLADVESLFIVTHRSDLMLPTDSSLTIIKDEKGISRIQ